jgi:2-polyprenyl-6-methoxyphenol hydroxylase-like FAD-dependent oxidoreductase
MDASMKSEPPRVLIVGAGPTGLTLACDLARRRIPLRVVDSAPEPFMGSRAKGLQPRTLEVFEDLGILETVLALGGDYPRFCTHVGPFSVRGGGLNRIVAPSPAAPYPNLWMLPQWRTCELLRERLAQMGFRAEHGVALQSFEQDDRNVVATVRRPAGEEQIRSEFLVGCDGGHSLVRKTLGIPLVGDDLEGAPTVMADLEIEGLDRAYWHVWPFAKKCLLTLCPLSSTSSFQLAAPLRSGVEPPELTEAGIRRFIDGALGAGKLRVGRVQWVGLYRSVHARMVERYRVGRAFLAGDAAHVHPPSGGQGLNTGVQDSYNLGWKLASVLGGASDSLLDTYEAERLPIAASVLGLSKKLFLKRSIRRGKETHQLDLHYRGGALATDTRARPGRVCAGDRAPDARGQDFAVQPRRIFEMFHGVHWTLLSFGGAQDDALTEFRVRWAPFIRVVRVLGQPENAGADDFVDVQGYARANYDVHSNALVLVRPDGYVGYFSEPESWTDLEAYLMRVLGARHRSPLLLLNG